MLTQTPIIPIFEVPTTREHSLLSAAQKQEAIQRLKLLLRSKNAVVIAHYYTAPEIQQLAEESGGVVADSLAMAEFGVKHPASTLMVAGVRFMGETAKILSPEKKVLMPTLEATCSLDLSCPADQFAQFCDAHSDRTVVVYANTSAVVKARADWVVTSSIAVEVVDYLDAKGEKIFWAPDRFLGDYIQKQTGADMLLWQGSCVVHEEFKTEALRDLKTMYSEAGVLVHPESPPGVIALADVVGSTSKLIEAAHVLPNEMFIVATDRGIFYKMQQVAPGKTFIAAPTMGYGATCKSCAHCPWMAMNTLENLEASLVEEKNEIIVDKAIIEKAKIPLERMLKFKQHEKKPHESIDF